MQVVKSYIKKAFYHFNAFGYILQLSFILKLQEKKNDIDF